MTENQQVLLFVHAEGVDATECVHHWMIDSPSGTRLSSGKCKHCGETRAFANSVEYSEWYGYNKTRPFKRNGKGKFK